MDGAYQRPDCPSRLSQLSSRIDKFAAMKLRVQRAILELGLYSGCWGGCQCARRALEVASVVLAGDPFDAAEAYGRARWRRLREVRQFGPRSF